MKPWEIAARVCRPMSTAEAMRLAHEEVGVGREMPDIDPQLEAEMVELQAEIERLDHDRGAKR